MTATELGRTREELARGITSGWHTGAQVYASLHGEPVADFAIGESRPGVAMTSATIVEWASATKPVTCSAPALLQRRLLPPPLIEAMTSRHLCGAYNETVHATVDRGLGFSLSSSYPGHGYGPHASRRAFGHGGGSWSIAFADPAHNLAAAVYYNGRVDAATQAQRHPALLAALYEDLGLV